MIAVDRATGHKVSSISPISPSSVNASAVGRPVEIHAYADRIVIRHDGRVVAEHARHHGCGETIYDPWHYVPVLARKSDVCV